MKVLGLSRGRGNEHCLLPAVGVSAAAEGLQAPYHSQQVFLDCFSFAAAAAGAGSPLACNTESEGAPIVVEDVVGVVW